MTRFCGTILGLDRVSPHRVLENSQGRLASKTCVVLCKSWSTRAHSLESGDITNDGMVLDMFSPISKTATGVSKACWPESFG